MVGPQAGGMAAGLHAHCSMHPRGAGADPCVPARCALAWAKTLCRGTRKSGPWMACGWGGLHATICRHTAQAVAAGGGHVQRAAASQGRPPGGRVVPT